jgi:hypothetical protein
LQACLNKLLYKGIVYKDVDNQLYATPVLFRTPDNFPYHLMRNRQYEGLKNSMSLIKKKCDLNFGAFSTIPINDSKLPDAKLLIEDFMKKLSTFLSDANANEVYELNIHLSPRSKK